MIDWNQLPFAGDPLIGQRIALYRDAFGITTCVETGTQVGATTRALSHMFNQVFSVEIAENYYAAALENLADRENARLIHGASEAILPTILPELWGQRSILFFLDAHGFGSDCPLLRECAAIAQHRKGKDVIVIHDFAVPDRPELGFDSYNGQPIDIGYVSESMNLVFPSGWTVRYNDVACGPKRGCAFFVSK